jgi:hypothetical protein
MKKAALIILPFFLGGCETVQSVDWKEVFSFAAEILVK